MSDNDWDQLIQGLRKGDPDACADFWNRYGTQLESVAQRQISQRLQRRVGSDDVVQSACRTFLRRVSHGQFDLPDADALWRLMCAITLTKARRAARDHGRLKRGLQAEQYLDAAPADDSVARHPDLAANDDSPFDAAAFSDQMEKLFAGLTAEECQVVDFKLQNHTNEEIADQLQCSERTVRRLTAQIRDRWTVLFDENSEPG